MARRRSGKKIDFTSWFEFSLTQLGLAAGTSAATVIGTSDATATLLRIRGNLSAFIDGASAPGKQVLVAVGMILVPVGTGTTVLRSPFADGAAPWMWLTYFSLGYEEMVTDVIDVPGMTSYRETIDNKAMRIKRPDTELQLVRENVTINAAAAINVHVAGRVLVGT